MIKAVIFDLDDTLISEREYVYSGFRHVASVLHSLFHVNEEKVVSELIRLFNIDQKHVFDRVLELYNIDHSSQTIQNMVDEYRGHMPAIKFFDDVIPLLFNLRQQKIKTGIITDGFCVSQRQKLLAVEASKYFDKIIITDEFGREFWKPHPKSFELMREEFMIEFDEMIYIGDNPEKDFYISKYYPIMTIRIMRHEAIHSKRQYYMSIKENVTIKTLNEINKYLAESR